MCEPLKLISWTLMAERMDQLGIPPHQNLTNELAAELAKGHQVIIVRKLGEVKLMDFGPGTLKLGGSEIEMKSGALMKTVLTRAQFFIREHNQPQ